MEHHQCSAQAERALLGALMRSDDAWWRIQGRVERADFHVADHATLFDRIARLREADQPVDIITVNEDGGGDVDWLGC